MSEKPGQLLLGSSTVLQRCMHLDTADKGGNQGRISALTYPLLGTYEQFSCFVCSKQYLEQFPHELYSLFAG